MRPDESFVGQPVRSLQTMLRVIAQSDPDIPSVIPDGIYGTDTMRSVSAFQRSRGLPITGTVDQQTWEAIVIAYDAAIVEQAEAQPLNIILNPGEVIKRGDRNANLYIIQAVLTVLSETYAQITPPSQNGVLDLATGNSLMSFQQLHQLPVTGEVDKLTWKRLALQYPLAAGLISNSATI